MKVLKPVVTGALLGAAVFFMPFFIIKVALFALVIGFIWRMFSWRRHWHGYHYLAWTDKIRNMNEEEYSAFKEKMNRWNYGCGHRYQDYCDERPEIKKDNTNI